MMVRNILKRLSNFTVTVVALLLVLVVEDVAIAHPIQGDSPELGSVSGLESPKDQAYVAREEVRAVNDALDHWDVDAAARGLSKFEGNARAFSDGGKSAVAEMFKARLAYLRGDYKEALASIDRIRIEVGRLGTNLSEFRDRVEAVSRAISGYKKVVSPRGWFEVAVRPGKDELLLPLTFKALESAYRLLTERLGSHPKTPIRVELYPSYNTLAEVSSLTQKDIRTTGTIALCKYNRLMVTSPSAQPYGYPWVDTMVHEFVHYLVMVRTPVGVPIWLHEGLAKTLERSWRTEDPLSGNEGMLPSMTSMLSKRVKEGKLIEFAAMHPSMAKLASQEDASLAFAEVHSLMNYVIDHAPKGSNPLKTTLDKIDSGVDAGGALASTLGISFRQLELRWKGDLRTRKFAYFPDDATYEERLDFKNSSAKLEQEQDKIENPKGKDYAALAMLLQARGRTKGALVEFRKSIAITGPIYPFTVTRMAVALNESGKEEDAEEAVKLLTSLVKLYPSFAPAYRQLGHGYNTLKEYEKARSVLEESEIYNPFDPGIYGELATAYNALGMREEAEKARRSKALLGE